MATAGPLSAGSGATAGSSVWSNPTNVTASDDARATTTILASGTSGTLTTSSHGFTIPAATIDGIEISIERSSTTNNVINDSSIRLAKAGSAVGDNKATATKWPLNTDSSATYGGAADLWGTTWSVAEVNDSGFGVVIIAANSDAGASRVARVDHVTITVTYTEGGSTVAAARHYRVQQQ
jgi:hypothetical protein